MGLVDRFFPDTQKITLSDIIRITGGTCVEEAANKNGTEFKSIKSLGSAGNEDLSFISSNRFIEAVRSSGARGCLLTERMVDSVPDHMVKIVVKDVFYAVKLIMEHLFAEQMAEKYDMSLYVNDTTTYARDQYDDKGRWISSMACIGRDVKLGNGVSIGPNVIIGDGVELGDKVRICANSVVGRNVKLGDNSTVNSGSVIEFTVAGNNFTSGSGSVIGGNGFKIIPSDTNNLTTYDVLMHVGGVSIGDNFTCFDQCVINRGTLDDTELGSNCVIGNSVVIAHNSFIGDSSCIICGSTIAGGTRLMGKNILSGESRCCDGAVIGEGAQVLYGAVVSGPVERGSRVIGCPAVPISTEQGKAILREFIAARKRGL